MPMPDTTFARTTLPIKIDDPPRSKYPFPQNFHNLATSILYDRKLGKLPIEEKRELFLEIIKSLKEIKTRFAPKLKKAQEKYNKELENAWKDRVTWEDSYDLIMASIKEIVDFNSLNDSSPFFSDSYCSIIEEEMYQYDLSITKARLGYDLKKTRLLVKYYKVVVEIQKECEKEIRKYIKKLEKKYDFKWDN